MQVGEDTESLVHLDCDTAAELAANLSHPGPWSVESCFTFVQAESIAHLLELASLSSPDTALTLHELVPLARHGGLRNQTVTSMPALDSCSQC
jgi:hypothetical protein